MHLNSTDGDTDYALDLTNRRFVRLSANWAAPIPLPGEPGFLTMNYERYVPISGSEKTANCSYMERWDSNLKKVRYARKKTAAICYGASMYRPGKSSDYGSQEWRLARFDIARSLKGRRSGGLKPPLLGGDSQNFCDRR